MNVSNDKYISLKLAVTKENKIVSIFQDIQSNTNEIGTHVGTWKYLPIACCVSAKRAKKHITNLIFVTQMLSELQYRNKQSKHNLPLL